MATAKQRKRNVQRAKSPSIARMKAQTEMETKPYRKKAKADGYEDSVNGVIKWSHDRHGDYTKELMKGESSNLNRPNRKKTDD